MDDERFTGIAKRATSVLAAVSLQAYPVDAPAAAVDAKIASVCAGLEATSAAQREVIRWALTTHQRNVLGRYGHRAATLAIRERSAARLHSGLLAIALSTTADDDERDVMVGIALHHHVATQLGLSPAEVFDQAARYAEPAVAELLRAFGRRTDVTLAAFGWREVTTEHGPGFGHGPAGPDQPTRAQG